MVEKIEKVIAEKVKQEGGRTFYVGGYVRDKLLGIDNKDVDIEVHGIDANEDEAKLLNIECNTPLIKQYGYTFSDEGDEIEYTECIMRIERFEFLK